MTYLALAKTNRFKVAVVTSWLANALEIITGRPAMEQNVFSQLIPNYWSTRSKN